MPKRVIRRKLIVVDGQRYEASVTATYADVVKLRVTVRADFGTRSFVTISGLQNYDYFHHYGHWAQEGYAAETDTIEITPRMLAALIRYAHDNGWSPESEKPNCNLTLTNVDAKALLAAYDEDDGENAT